MVRARLPRVALVDESSTAMLAEGHTHRPVAATLAVRVLGVVRDDYHAADQNW
jgi:hypothetical protein